MSEKPKQERLKFENEDLYDELKKPFPSQEAAEEALGNFLEAVGKVREEHKIANIAFAIRITFQDENDIRKEANASFFMGLSEHALGMAAKIYHDRKKEYLEALKHYESLIAKGEA